MGTFSIWHWIIVLVVFPIPIVIGAWTAWNRHLTYKQYLIAYAAVFVVTFIISTIGHANFEGGWVLLFLPVVPLIHFTGVHITVRRLHTIGWKRWMGVVPVLNSVVSFVMLFNPKPDPQK